MKKTLTFYFRIISAFGLNLSVIDAIMLLELRGEQYQLRMF